MLFKDTVDLLVVDESTVINGVPTKSVTSRNTVFANLKSIRQSEFYQASAQGIQLDAMFEVRSIDYSNEKYLEHNSVEYKIIRTFSKNGEITELSCSDLSTKGGITVV